MSINQLVCFPTPRRSVSRTQDFQLQGELICFLHTERKSVRVPWDLSLMRAQLCPGLCNPMDCSPPGSSVHGIFQVRILEWVAIFYSRGSSQPLLGLNPGCTSWELSQLHSLQRDNFNNLFTGWLWELNAQRLTHSEKDWRQEEKGITEDEVVGWHHQLNGPEFEQALGDSGRGGWVASSTQWTWVWASSGR